MTRKTFAALAALFSGAIPADALDKVRGMTNPLGRGWVQVSAHRAVQRHGKYDPTDIVKANARNGVGSSKRRIAVRGY